MIRLQIAVTSQCARINLIMCSYTCIIYVYLSFTIAKPKYIQYVPYYSTCILKLTVSCSACISSEFRLRQSTSLMTARCEMKHLGRVSTLSSSVGIVSVTRAAANVAFLELSREGATNENIGGTIFQRGTDHSDSRRRIISASTRDVSRDMSGGVFGRARELFDTSERIKTATAEVGGEAVPLIGIDTWPTFSSPLICST